MIESRSRTNSWSGELDVSSSTTIFVLNCWAMNSMSSNPNRHNRSRCATTISWTSPDKIRSKRALSPFRLKLIPDPISWISSWLGYFVLIYCICLSRSSFWFLELTRAYIILVFPKLSEERSYNLRLPGVRIVLILPWASQFLRVFGCTPNFWQAVFVFT